MQVKTFDGLSDYLLRSSPGEAGHWMEAVGVAQDASEQNLLALQFQGDVYYQALKDIASGDRLAVFLGAGLPVHKGEDEAAEAPQVGGALECGLCPASHFQDYAELAAHRKSPRHQPLDDVRCRLCPYVARGVQGRKTHVSLSHAERFFACPKCPRKLTTAPRLARHIQRRHGRQDRRFPCQTCGKAFLLRHHLDRHIALSHGAGGPSVPCPKCDKVLATQESLRHHLDAVHGDGHRPFACPACPKAFATSVYLNRHKRLVHAKKPKAPKAEIASSPSSSGASSSSEPALDCRFCGLRCATVGSRQRHEKRKHPDQLAAIAPEVPQIELGLVESISSLGFPEGEEGLCVQPLRGELREQDAPQVPPRSPLRPVPRHLRGLFFLFQMAI